MWTRPKSPRVRASAPTRSAGSWPRGAWARSLASRADDTYRLQVAIKVVRAGLHPQFLARFRAERRILAGLNHPNIARLLDGGTGPDGQPYVVMEYIDGIPVDDYCREHSLPVRERLRLFLQVCDAVAYAHRNLIIHRDIKPANVLVTAGGTAKLLDFGMSRADLTGCRGPGNVADPNQRAAVVQVNQRRLHRGSFLFERLVVERGPRIAEGGARGATVPIVATNQSPLGSGTTIHVCGSPSWPPLTAQAAKIEVAEGLT